MTRIAVIGGSVEAVQIGCEFALGGCAVQLLGAEEPVAAQAVEEALRLASARGLAGPPELERARALIAPAAEAEGRIALVVEALPESVDQKAAAIATCAAPHPEALVATTSEAIGPTEIGQAAGVPERMLAARYGSPPMLVGIVELAAARDTPARLVDRVAQLLRAIGKQPVVLRREVPGMISGRLELALLRECRRLIDEGAADGEQVDAVAAQRLAPVWAAIGPLGSAALRAPGSLERLAEASGEDRAAAVELGAIVAPGADLRALAERRDEALARVDGNTGRFERPPSASV